MGKFYAITVLVNKERKDFYFEDMVSAIIQFREFMEQAWIKEKIKWDLPVSFEYGDWNKLTLRELEWSDNKLYHLWGLEWAQEQ